jgi:hypothetical protein
MRISYPGAFVEPLLVITAPSSGREAASNSGTNPSKTSDRGFTVTGS